MKNIHEVLAVQSRSRRNVFRQLGGFIGTKAASSAIAQEQQAHIYIGLGRVALKYMLEGSNFDKIKPVEIKKPEAPKQPTPLSVVATKANEVGRVIFDKNTVLSAKNRLFSRDPFTPAMLKTFENLPPATKQAIMEDGGRLTITREGMVSMVWKGSAK